MLRIDQQDKVYTVSRLNSEAKALLEDNFALIWVEGEISNFAAPNSGHWYFSIKDASAQARCAMFRGSSRKLNFVPKDGMHVLIRARVSLYENRGEFQLIAEDMEERGEGKLRRAFEILKKKLQAAGLFNDIHKKPIPRFPQCIGVVTSPTGAAIRDILNVLKRRYPCVPVIIYPSLVQGSTAAPTIAQAVQIANRRKECDILIVARGGGSLEDLWPFNEEIVANAIFQSQIPVISGVGHEVDFTIADFVADRRAPTPSAAAELVTPDSVELLKGLQAQHNQVLRLLKNKLTAKLQHLSWVQKHLSQQHPKRRLLEKMQRLDFCELRLKQLVQEKIHAAASKLKNFDNILHRYTPLQAIHTQQHQLTLLQQRYHNAMSNILQKQHAKLGKIVVQLDAISPLATLKRGYAIATNASQEVVRDAKQVSPGDKITIQLQNGCLACLVEKIV